MPIKDKSRSVAIAGADEAGICFAYSLLAQGICERLHIISGDRGGNEETADGLCRCLTFSPSNMEITSGGYENAADYGVLAIFGGSACIPGGDRSASIEIKIAAVESIVKKSVTAGFEGIYLIAAEPVDIMTMAMLRASGYMDSERAGQVIGSGTMADSACLRYHLGRYFGVNPHSVHACVMGEHGESGFIPWSQASIYSKPVLNVVEDSSSRYSYEGLLETAEKVKNSARTANGFDYSTGIIMARLTKAIFGDEKSVFTVSSLLKGEYGQHDVCAGTPCVIGRDGVESKVRLSLLDYELKQLDDSCSVIRSAQNAATIGI